MTFGEWTQEAADRCEAFAKTSSLEHELGIKGHEDTCNTCGPVRTCKYLDGAGASGMLAWCPIGQGEKVCINCNWTGTEKAVGIMEGKL